MNRTESQAWGGLVGWTQWDKLVMTLGLACVMPMLVHILPLGQGIEKGPVWLPMYYAPLMAALLYRPQVALLTSLLAPGLNHYLFGMPSWQLVPQLTFELIFFSLLLILVSHSRRMNGGLVVLVVMVVRFISAAMFISPDTENLPGRVLALLALSWPGVLVMAVLTEIKLRGRWGKTRAED